MGVVGALEKIKAEVVVKPQKRQEKGEGGKSRCQRETGQDQVVEDQERDWA